MLRLAREGTTEGCDGAGAGAWRKSRRSLANGNCVEVASAAGDLVRVRDSTQPGGTVLGFNSGLWLSFITDVRSGIFTVRA